MKNYTLYFILIAFITAGISSCSPKYGCPNSHAAQVKPKTTTNV